MTLETFNKALEIRSDMDNIRHILSRILDYDCPDDRPNVSRIEIHRINVFGGRDDVILHKCLIPVIKDALLAEEARLIKEMEEL